MSYDILVGIKSQLAYLDMLHARATSPKQRRKIEKRIEELKAFVVKERELGKIVDLEWERWKKSLEKEFRKP